MRDRLYNIALKRPWIVLLLAIVLVFATAYAVKNLVIKEKYKIVFSSAEHPEMSAEKTMQGIYSNTTKSSQPDHTSRLVSVTPRSELASKVPVIREKL
ncbi:hypothetical protein A9R01_12345 ['Osedax' symbiont bacterium Rs2_46_30_T18]|nr:hypothetical protein A9R01_12345 ['Osedax' symbiont bacterium Rs2_46_30_T18]